jgi:arylsulfatase A-like enzyme
VANIFWTGRHTGLARGFLHYEDYYGTVVDALQRMTLVRDIPAVVGWRVGAGELRGRKRASQINGDFLGWLDRLDGRPFFAFLNYMDVHVPYLPPAPQAGRFGPIRPELRSPSGEAGDQSQETFSAEPMTFRIDRYDESTLYLDEQIGELLDQLERRGLIEKTVIVVTADHGEHLGEHGLVEHGKSLYAMETRVPLILHYPGVSPVRVTSPVSTINLAATIAALADLPDSPFPGQSLVAAPESARIEAIPVVSEMGGTGVRDAPAGKGWLKSLVSGQWHFIIRQNGTAELFDISRDTAETTNLAATPQGQEVAQDLRARLERIIGGPMPGAQATLPSSSSPSGFRPIATRPGRQALP